MRGVVLPRNQEENGKLNTAAVIALSKMKSWHRDPRIIAAFFLGLALCFLNEKRYLAFAAAAGCPIQVVESYIVAGSIVTSFTGMLLGVLLLLSDAPFIEKLSPYEIIRTGKTKWIAGRIFYIVLSCMLYSLIMAMFSMLLSLSSDGLSLADEWSPAMLMLSGKQPEFARTEFGLFFPYPGFTSAMRPYEAAVLTLALNSCYFCLLCLCILAVNIRNGHNFGWAAAAGIHIGGYLISMNVPLMPAYASRLSLLLDALPAGLYTSALGNPVLPSALTLIGLVCVFAGISLHFAHHYEI